MATEPPWQYPWDYEFVPHKTIGKDFIARNPRTRQFTAVLQLCSGSLKVHGPFVSEADAHDCIRSRCDCWKPRVKEDQKAARHVLGLHVNQPEDT